MTITLSRSEKLISFYLIILFIQVPINGAFFSANLNLGTLLYGLIDFFILFYFISLGITKKNLKKNFRVSITSFIYIAWIFITLFWSETLDLNYTFGLIVKELLRVLVIVFIFADIEFENIGVTFYHAVSNSALLYGIISLPRVDFVAQLGMDEPRAMYIGYKDSVGVGRPATLLCLLTFSGYMSNFISKKQAIFCKSWGQVFLCAYVLTFIGKVL